MGNETKVEGSPRSGIDRDLDERIDRLVLARSSIEETCRTAQGLNAGGGPTGSAVTRLTTLTLHVAFERETRNERDGLTDRDSGDREGIVGIDASDSKTGSWRGGAAV